MTLAVNHQNTLSDFSDTPRRNLTRSTVVRLSWRWMYLTRPEIHAAAAACEQAARRTGEDWAATEIADEDDFTSRLIDRIATQLSEVRLGGVRWSARKTTSRFAGSEEARSGADLLGVLRVDTPEIKLRKGFLAQAKLNKPGNVGALREQCRNMLRVTPDSFVFLYDKTGVRVAPALLYASGSLGIRHVESWSFDRFFAAHFSSFIGDARLDGTSKPEFEEVLRDANPRDVLVVSATRVPS